MGYIEGFNSNKDRTVNPFAVVLDEVNKGYERRRSEDKLREEEDYKLKQLFAKMKQEQDNALALQDRKSEQEIEKEYTKGEIEGTIRPRAMAGTPMEAVGNAMQPTQPEPMMSMASGGVGDITEKPIVPREAVLAKGITQQAGLSPKVVKSPSGKEYEQIDRDNIPEGFEITGYDAKGKPRVTKIKPTQGQETTALYAERLKQANDVFDSLEDFTSKQGTKEYAESKLPGFMNFAKSKEMQSYQQAQRNFLNAVLRRESGAVISPSEFTEGRQQYFPQPGDKPEVLAQKKANRDLVMKNFTKGAGPAYVPYEEPGQSQSKLTPQQRQELIQKIRNKNAR